MYFERLGKYLFDEINAFYYEPTYLSLYPAQLYRFANEPKINRAKLDRISAFIRQQMAYNKKITRF